MSTSNDTLGLFSYALPCGLNNFQNGSRSTGEAIAFASE